MFESIQPGPKTKTFSWIQKKERSPSRKPWHANLDFSGEPWVSSHYLNCVPLKDLQNSRSARRCPLTKWAAFRWTLFRAGLSFWWCKCHKWQAYWFLLLTLDNSQVLLDTSQVQDFNVIVLICGDHFFFNRIVRALHQITTISVDEWRCRMDSLKLSCSQKLRFPF